MSSPDLFKEVMPSIMENKRQVFVDDDEVDSYYAKNSFIINRVLSMHPDCVIQANYLNTNAHLAGKLKHDYLLNIIRGYKRKYNYAKSAKYENLDIISRYYGIGMTKAKEYSMLLTSDQIEILKQRLNDKGGVKK